MEDTFKQKDKMISECMTEVKKGITSCEIKKGVYKDTGHVETEYGNKPLPYK